MANANRAKQQNAEPRVVMAADFAYFTQKLQARMGVIRSSILETSTRLNSELRTDTTGQVHDAKDDAFASRQAEAELREMSHELAEIRDIESAQLRIVQGEYGRCVACGEAIAWLRLDACPTASRCVSCQERLEHLPGAAIR